MAIPTASLRILAPRVSFHQVCLALFLDGRIHEARKYFLSPLIPICRSFALRRVSPSGQAFSPQMWLTGNCSPRRCGSRTCSREIQTHWLPIRRARRLSAHGDCSRATACNTHVYLPFTQLEVCSCEYCRLFYCYCCPLQSRLYRRRTTARTHLRSEEHTSELQSLRYL